MARGRMVPWTLAASKQITASFNVPYAGLEAHDIVWGPTQDALKHVTGGGTARNTGTINPPSLGGPTSGQLTFPVTGSGDIFAQVTFQCQWSAADKCMPGKSGDAVDLDWVLSTPVKVNIGKAGGTTKTVKVTPTAVPKSNGTKACDAARARIVYANSEIQEVVNNLNFANKLNDNQSVQSTRQKQLTQRLAQLRAQIAVHAKVAAEACRQRPASPNPATVWRVVAEGGIQEMGALGRRSGAAWARLAANLAGTTLPLVGLMVAVALLWDRLVGVRELTILLAGYLLSGIGITVGFHRLFTHRSFETSRPLRYAFAVLGEAAVEGSVVSWVANHRKHHQFSDRSGDPHSPHADYGDGFVEGLKGLWHAHTGWLFDTEAVADRDRYAKDLVDDRGLRVIGRLFAPIVVLSLVLPGLVGWWWIGGRYGFVAGLVWGGAVRILLLHHVTWSINSICHYWGRRRFAVRDESRNVWWLSWLSFGESWHNNHHAFPSSAFHGLRAAEIDPGGWVIRALEACGLAWRVVRIPPERQAVKAAVPAAPSSTT